jgi:hypothetical protein
VGRGEELIVIGSFLARARSQSTVLVIEGEPGIGKTTLWQEGVSQAGARGTLVLVARAAQAETGLSFAGLTDLLDPVADDVVLGLPSPQKDALLTALLKGPVPVGGVDERAVSAAVLSVLRALSEKRPLVVAVDDAQWMDPASARALAFRSGAWAKREWDSS